MPSFENRVKSQFYSKNPIFDIMKTFFCYVPHQKADQMCLATSCRVTKVNKSGTKLNTELCKILIRDILTNIWSCVKCKQTTDKMHTASNAYQNISN